MTFAVVKTRIILAVCLLMLMNCGCNSLRYWRSNDFKVGPNYCPPASKTAATYSEAGSLLINPATIGAPQWWHVFNDPDLNDLIEGVYRQNLTLKQATWRIEEARALLHIQSTNLLPQQNLANGSYGRNQVNATGPPVSSDRWAIGYNSSWELDLWGKIRRNVDATNAQLEATIKDYDFALVSLIGDVATLYIQIRSFEERIELAKQNAKAFAGTLEIAKIRVEEEVASRLDVVQAESNLLATKVLIPRLEFGRQQSLNALSVLLAIPPGEITSLGSSLRGLPNPPAEVMVGIPAELLVRRPDIRAAERSLKANFEAIGIAEADLYPSFSISGNLGYSASELRDLFTTSGFTGGIGPAFSWNILNFGRIKNQVRANEARVNQLRFDFENRVLTAQQEVETSIFEFIKAHEEYQINLANEKLAQEAATIGMTQFKTGAESFNRLFVVQGNLVQVQDAVIANRAAISLALINTYRALGGGWEIRCENVIQQPMQSPAMNLPILQNSLPVEQDFEVINSGLIQSLDN